MNEKINILTEEELSEYVEYEGVSHYFAVKRLFDVIISIVGIFVMFPVAIIIKLAYIFTGDFHSIFYTQERIGKNGKKIYIYKFRSMVKDADKKLKELLKQEKYKEQWDKNQKLDNDPRITKIGKIIRKLSIDELPQFINVLKGDMAFIGPRPLVVGELDSHNGNHELYESVRPGITGWWACHGRSATNYEERLKLEYYYIKNISFKLDLECLFKTVKAVIKKEGAK